VNVDVFREKESRLYILLYAVMIAGIPFAVYRPGSFDFVFFKYSVNMAFFFLFLMHVDTMAKLKQVVVMLVVATFMFTTYSLVRGQFDYGRFFVGGQNFDPNDVAYVQVSMLGFPLWALLTPSFPKSIRIPALITLPCGVLLLLYTGSRGGVLAMGTLVLLFMFLGVKGVGKGFKAAIIVAMIVGVAYTGTNQINVERYSTIGSLENDYNFQAGGRIDIWTRGLHLFMADPITGVGVEGFPNAIGYMRTDEAGTIPVWQAAHSAYIQVLTELGIFGALFYLLLLVQAILTFNRIRKPGAGHDAELAALSGLLLSAFAAQLVAAAFLSQAYSVFFTLMFALSATLNRIASSSPPMVSGTPERRPEPWRPGAPRALRGAPSAAFSR